MAVHLEREGDTMITPSTVVPRHIPSGRHIIVISERQIGVDPESVAQTPTSTPQGESGSALAEEVATPRSTKCEALNSVGGETSPDLRRLFCATETP